VLLVLERWAQSQYTQSMSTSDTEQYTDLHYVPKNTPHFTACYNFILSASTINMHKIWQ